MSLSLLVLVLVVPLAAVLLLGVAAALGTERTGLHRGALMARWIGLLGGGAVMLGLMYASLSGTWPSGRLGLGALTGVAPLVGAGVLVLAIIAGELTIPAHGSARAGSLVPRTLAGLVPRTALALTALGVLVLLVLLALTSAEGAPDDLGNPGRSLEYSAGLDGGTALVGSTGPFPGSWYTVPAGIAAALLLTLGIAAALVIHRRRPSLDAADALLRSRSLVSVLGAVLVGMSVVTAGFASFAQHAYANAFRNAQDGFGMGSGPVVLDLPAWALPAMSIILVLGILGILTGMLMVCIPAVFARRARTRSARSAPLARSAPAAPSASSAPAAPSAPLTTPGSPS